MLVSFAKFLKSYYYKCTENSIAKKLCYKKYWVTPRIFKNSAIRNALRILFLRIFLIEEYWVTLQSLENYIIRNALEIMLLRNCAIRN